MTVDVLVVGAGFSGAITAMALARQGKRVALVERGTHPRFAIGESSTPLANLLLEDLADRYGLDRLRPFSKWGTWQRERPEVGCGLKRGFSFFFHVDGQSFQDTEQHRRQLLVAASPHDEIADTHWYRPDFDAALVRDAQDLGVEYLDSAALDAPAWHGDTVRVEGHRQGSPLTFQADFLIDASGPRGYLAQAMGLPSRRLPWLPPTAGLYTHFTGVRRWDSACESFGIPPYPVDDAALHHVFPGGWIWVLRFKNGITSAGAALTHALAADIGADSGAPGWARLLDRLPSVRAQFADATPTHPFVYSPQLAYRCERVAGPGWALLPSAAGVIDPLLSTGFPLTLLGVSRLLEVLETTAPGPARDRALADYEAMTIAELDITEQLVAALYSAMDDPPLFTRLAHVYFAAASFSETARRLGRASLAPGFLLHSHPSYGPGLRACLAQVRAGAARHDRVALFEALARLITPFDIAGLLDPDRQGWYPVTAKDLVENRAKLGASLEDVQQLLQRVGMTMPTP